MDCFSRLHRDRNDMMTRRAVVHTVPFGTGIFWCGYLFPQMNLWAISRPSLRDFDLCWEAHSFPQMNLWANGISSLTGLVIPTKTADARRTSRKEIPSLKKGNTKVTGIREKRSIFNVSPLYSHRVAMGRP